jgi:hypothetical protein
MLHKSSRCRKRSIPAPGPTPWPKIISQLCLRAARKQSWKQSRWSMYTSGRTGWSWKASWKTSSDTPTAEAICRWDHTRSDFEGTSWNVETLARKPVSPCTTTSAGLWSTPEPWPST